MAGAGKRLRVTQGSNTVGVALRSPSPRVPEAERKKTTTTTTKTGHSSRVAGGEQDKQREKHWVWSTSSLSA